MSHVLFQNPNLQSDDPAIRIAALDVTLAEAKAHAKALQQVEQMLSATLAEAEAQLAQERGDRRGLQDRCHDLREALAQLARGVTEHDGTLPELVPFVNTPSLTETRDTIAALKADRLDWLPLRDTPDALGVYRLLPDVGTHYAANGECVFAGETIELTLRQYRSFSDKFEPVEEPVEETANAPEGALVHG